MAQSLLANQSLEQAALVAEQALPRDPGPERPSTWSYFTQRFFGQDASLPALPTPAEAQRQYPLKAILVGHKQAVRIIAVSASGRLIVTAAQDGELRFWDANTGLETRPPLDEKGVVAAAFASDDQHLGLGFFNGGVGILNLESGDLVSLPNSLAHTEGARQCEMDACVGGVMLVETGAPV